MNPPPGTVPAFQAPTFACPRCTIVTTHMFQVVNVGQRADQQCHRSECAHCRQHAYWVNQKLVWPEPVLGDENSADLPSDLVPLYSEARSIAARSPRAAAALLRLLIDQLIQSLGATGRTLDRRVGDFVQKQEPSRALTNSLDAVRVGGNNALHEGQIDPSGQDDAAMVEMLFTVVNDIVEQTIGRPAKLKRLLGPKERPLDSK